MTILHVNTQFRQNLKFKYAHKQLIGIRKVRSGFLSVPVISNFRGCFSTNMLVT